MLAPRGPRNAATRASSQAFFLLKAAISTALVVWIAYRFEWPAVLTELRRLPWAYPALAYLAVLAGYGLFAVRLQCLLAAQSIAVGLGPLLRITFVALFAGNLLPSSLGGDAVKLALLLRQRHHRRSHLALSVLADRAANVAATVLLLALVLTLPGLASPVFRLPPSLLPLFPAGLALAGALALLGFPAARRWLQGAGARQEGGAPQGRWARTVESLRHAAANWASAPGALALALALSVVSTLLFYGAVGLLGGGLGIDLGPGDWIALQCVVAGVGILPLSLNGLGLQEVSVVYLLGRLGVAPEQAVAVALLNRLLLVTGTLPGALGAMGLRPGEGDGPQSGAVSPPLVPGAGRGLPCSGAAPRGADG